MTTVGKIGITGIRSYGEDEQIIKFSKPLTIILGHNGSGKSTIIEAVKMATTGDLPPMVSQGAAFINDPRITSSSETLAKIRLQFTNVRGEEYLVSRHFSLRQIRPGKQEFKTIDQTLKRTSMGTGVTGGGSSSTSHRCAELNALLPDIMRVTKPILNSVIFVHQEDSLWPLGDPKKLKERFDDIFAATRYTKALESIRKFRKEQSADLRVINVELLHHADRAKTCDKLRADADDIRTRESKLRAGVQAIRAEMAAIKVELIRAQAINNEYEERQKKLTELNAKVSVLEADRDQKFALLAEELSELSDQSLDKLIDDLEDELRRSEGERRDRTVQISAIRSELEAITKSYNDCQSRRGALEAEAVQQKERIERLDAMKREFLKSMFEPEQCQVPGIESVPALDSDYALWTLALTTRRSRAEERVHALTLERHQAEDEASNLVKDRQVSLSAIDASIQRNKDLAAVTRAAASSKREALRGIQGSADLIAAAKAEEKRFQEHLASVESSDDIATANAMYESARKEYNNLRELVADKRQERLVLVRDHDARVAIQHKRELVSQKEKDLVLVTEGLLEKVTGIASELDMITPTNRKESARSQLEQREEAVDLLNRVVSRRDRVLADASKTVKTASEKHTISIARQDESTKALIVAESSLFAAEEELRLLKSELSENELTRLGGPEAVGRLVTSTGSHGGVTVTQANFALAEEALSAAEAAEKKAARNVGVVSYERVFVGLLLDDFDRSKDSTGRHTCPTCGMSAVKEEKVLAMRNKMVQNLDEKSDPNHEGKMKDMLLDAESTLGWLRRVRDLAKELLGLKRTQLSALKLAGEASEEAASLKLALGNAESNLAELSRKYGETSDVRGAENLSNELRRKAEDRDRAKSDLRKATAYLPAGSGTRNVSDVENEIQVFEERILKVQDVMDQTRREVDQAREERSLAESRFRNAKDERVELEQNYETRRRLETEKDDLSSRLRQIEVELGSDKEKRPDLEGDLRVAEEKYKAVRSETVRVSEAANSEIVNIDKALSSWSSCLTAAELYISLKKDDALNTLLRHMEKTKTEIERLRSDDHQVSREAENASDALRQKEAEVRNARDNKKYRTLKAELRLYQAQSRDCRRDVERMCEEAGAGAVEAVAAAEARAKGRDSSVNAMQETGFSGHGSVLGSGREPLRRRGPLTRIEPSEFVEELTEQYNEKNAWCHATEGKAQVYTERWALKMEEVKEADRHGSRKKYEQSRIKKQTMELASSDLDRYHRALDQALMAYHTLKMDTINKIVKELWQLTYTGTDIDEIEIVSDAGDVAPSIGGSTSVGAIGGSGKRSYNYRVVMRRGDAVLDMRGRCSAGQKVLACLAIRLALAESFCTDCGILALDEPTTNLDRDNVESLAKALRGIIEHRKKQAHFQLILISHDQDFLAMMGARQYCDDYYLIHKDSNGNSVRHIRLAT
jgi:DNA repair protein RAD50